MKILKCALLALVLSVFIAWFEQATSVAASTQAVFVYSDPSTKLTVRGYDEECVAELPFGILFLAATQGIPPESFRRAEADENGATIEACWSPLPAGKVFLIDELGNYGVVTPGLSV